MTEMEPFTMVPNIVLDKLYHFRIPGEERLCFDYIVRKTYGYGKHEDMISNSQFVEATGLRKGNVSRALKSLVNKNVVIKNDNKRIATYRINDKTTSWKLLSKKQPVIKKATAVIKRDNDLLSKERDTKERKETIQKTDRKRFVPPSLEELKAFFLEKGFNQETAQKAFEYYAAGNWKDSKGNQVKNWKQKMIAVWFKPENKTKPQQPQPTHHGMREL